MPSITLSQQIKTIGKNYLAKYPKKDNLGRHTNQAVAQKMMEYDPSAADYCNKPKDFLIKRLLELPKLDGELAKTILAFSRDVLDDEIKADDLIRGISLERIHQLGDQYLSQFKGRSIWHGNQQSAKKLKNYCKDPRTQNIIANPEIRTMWDFLVDIYAELPASSFEKDGLLGKSIAALFKLALNFEMPDRLYIVGGSSNPVFMEYTPQQISEKIKPLIAHSINEALDIPMKRIR